MFIIMELCPKGSLFNLLHNSSVKLSYSQRVPFLVREPPASAVPPAAHRCLHRPTQLAAWSTCMPKPRPSFTAT